jgi:hypothetical protein
MLDDRDQGCQAAFLRWIGTRIEGQNNLQKMLIDREKMLVLPFTKSPVAWLFALEFNREQRKPCNSDYWIQYRHRT